LFFFSALLVEFITLSPEPDKLLLPSFLGGCLCFLFFFLLLNRILGQQFDLIILLVFNAFDQLLFVMINLSQVPVYIFVLGH
tara:strand:+ start:1086 stop:1331 length:246 start_codon:yes stop_codon:yes gene_type:complete